jgi:threonine synthase
MSQARYLCPACGATLAADRPMWRCDCGSHLNLAPEPGITRRQIDADDASLWRYRAALALAGAPRVSLGEGWTPLVTREWDGAPVRFKLESQMPTGSFKDRGTVVMLNHLLEVGVGPIHEDSSGNAGSSIATYAAAAGIACRIFVPASAPRGKVVQIAASGAAVEAIPGTRQAVTEAALAATGGSFYASHNSPRRRSPRPVAAFTPAIIGNLSLSKAPRPWLMSCGSSSALRRPTTSWCRPVMAAIFWGLSAVLMN